MLIGQDGKIAVKDTWYTPEEEKEYLDVRVMIEPLGPAKWGM